MFKVQKFPRQIFFLLIGFLVVTVLSGYVLSSSSNLAYAQLSGCGQIEVGQPGSNVSIPPLCNSQTESAIVRKVIALAKAHLKTGTYIMGTPSRNWGSDGLNPPHFDCSGFVGWAWYYGSDHKAVMLGQTNADFARSNATYKRVITTDASQLQPGDAVYFDNNMQEPQPGHVGLYVGKDSCGADDCFMQYYSTGLPGNELSLKYATSHGWGSMMGYVRINVQ